MIFSDKPQPFKRFTKILYEDDLNLPNIHNTGATKSEVYLIAPNKKIQKLWQKEYPGITVLIDQKIKL